MPHFCSFRHVMIVIFTSLMIILLFLSSFSSSSTTTTTTTPSLPNFVPYAVINSTRAAGDIFISQTVTDGEKYIYCTTQQSPARITRFTAKTSTTPFEKIDTLILENTENTITVATLNEAKTFLYVGLHLQPTEIVRINITNGNFSRHDKIVLNSDEDLVQFGHTTLLDNNNNNNNNNHDNNDIWLLGMYTTPARIVAVNISESNFSRISQLTLVGDSEASIIAMTSHPVPAQEGGNYVVFAGMQLQPTKISRILVNVVLSSNASSSERVNITKQVTITLQPGENNCASIFYHELSDVLLVSTDGVNAKLVKLAGSDLTRLQGSYFVHGGYTSGFFSPFLIDSHTLACTLLTAPGTFVRLHLENSTDTNVRLEISIVDDSIHGGNVTFNMNEDYPRTVAILPNRETPGIDFDYYYGSYSVAPYLVQVSLCPSCVTTTTTTITLPPFDPYQRITSVSADFSSSPQNLASCVGDPLRNIFYVGTNSENPVIIKRVNVSQPGQITTNFSTGAAEVSWNGKENAVSLNLAFDSISNSYNRLYVTFDSPPQVCAVETSNTMMVISSIPCFANFGMGIVTVGISLITNNNSYLLVSSSEVPQSSSIFVLKIEKTDGSLINDGNSIDFNQLPNPGKIVARTLHETNSTISYWCFDSSPAMVVAVSTIYDENTAMLIRTKGTRLTLNSGENKCASLAHQQQRFPSPSSDIGFLYLGTNQGGASIVKIQTDTRDFGSLVRVGSIKPGSYGLYSALFSADGRRLIYSATVISDQFILVDVEYFVVLDKVDFHGSESFVRFGAAFPQPQDRFIFGTFTSPQIIEFAKELPTSSTQTSSSTTTSTSMTSSSTSTATQYSEPFDPFMYLGNVNAGLSGISTCAGDGSKWIYVSTLTSNAAVRRYDVSEYNSHSTIDTSNPNNSISLPYDRPRASHLDSENEFLYLAMMHSPTPAALCRVRVQPNFTLDACLELPSTINMFHSGTFSNGEEFYLLGTFDRPAQVVAVHIDFQSTFPQYKNLSFAGVGTGALLTMPDGLDYFVTAATHSAPNSDITYFGTQTTPARICAIRNEKLDGNSSTNTTGYNYNYNLSLVDTFIIPSPSSNSLGSIIHHRDSNILYAGTRTSSPNANIVKFYAPEKGTLFFLDRLGKSFGGVQEMLFTEDGNYLVAATLSNPADFVVVSLQSFHVVQENLFGSGERAIRCSARYSGDRFWFGSYVGSYLVEWAKANWTEPPTSTMTDTNTSTTTSTTTPTATSSSSTTTETSTTSSTTTTTTTPTTTSTTTTTTLTPTSTTTSTTSTTDPNATASSTTTTSTTTITFTFAPPPPDSTSSTSANNENNTSSTPQTTINAPLAAPLPPGSAPQVGTGTTTVVAGGVGGAAPAAAQAMRALQMIDVADTGTRCKIFLSGEWDSDKMATEDRSFPDSFMPPLKISYGNETLNQRYGLPSRRGQIIANTVLAPVCVFLIASIFGYIRKAMLSDVFQGISFFAVGRCPGIVTAVTFAIAFPGTISAVVVLLGIPGEVPHGGDIALCIFALLVNIGVCIVPGVMLYREITYSRTTPMPIECVLSKVVSTAEGAPPPEKQRGIYPEEDKGWLYLMFGERVWTGDQQTVEKYRTLFAKTRGTSMKSELELSRFGQWRRRLATSSFFVECSFSLLSAILRGWATANPCAANGVAQPLLLIICIFAFLFSLIVMPPLSPFRRTCDIVANFVLMISAILLVAQQEDGERFIVRLALAGAFIATGSSFVLIFFRRIVLNLKKQNIVPRDKLLGTLAFDSKNQTDSAGKRIAFDLNPASIGFLVGGDDGDVAPRRYSQLQRRNLLGDESESMRTFRNHYDDDDKSQDLLHRSGGSAFSDSAKRNNTRFMTGENGGLSAIFDDHQQDDDAVRRAAAINSQSGFFFGDDDVNEADVSGTTSNTYSYSSPNDNYYNDDSQNKMTRAEPTISHFHQQRQENVFSSPEEKSAAAFDQL